MARTKPSRVVRMIVFATRAGRTPTARGLVQRCLGVLVQNQLVRDFRRVERVQKGFCGYGLSHDFP